MKKKFFAIILSFTMGITLLPSMAFADEGTDDPLDGSAIKEIAEQLQDETLDPFNYLVPKEATRATYPDKYDLRTEGLVTPVKLQNPFGTCWGFSAVAAAESSLLGSGIAAQDGLTASTLNLSEKHLVYFVSQPVKDKNSPQYGEGTHAASGMTLQERFDGGGVPFMATASFASGIGPILESRNPILEYRGKNGTRDGYCYSADDDWSIPEKWRFKSSYVLEESYMLPCPAQVSKLQDNYIYSYNAAGTKAIKDMLMRKYAVQIGFHANSPMLSDSSNNVNYMSTNWAHYVHNAGEQANHAVTIVGWDDTFSRSKFLATPPGNGAWLVKNSWGSEEEAFPNKGPGWGITNSKGQHTGYFWISYYDKSITMPEALKFEENKAGDTYNVDQHDFMPVTGVSGATATGLVKMANVFTAKASQKLEEVSCETTYPGTRVKSQIYLLPKTSKTPIDGKLVATVEATYGYGGFHKMKLSSAVPIQKGQRYSIVQTQYNVDGSYALNMPVAPNKNASPEIWQQGVINSGESYFYVDGTWYDYVRTDVKKELFGLRYAYLSFDNFPIKGYSTPAKDVKMSISGKTTLGNSNTNMSTKLKVSYVGNDASSVTSPQVTWTLGKGGSDLFTLKTSSTNPTTATVTNKRKSAGSALLYVTTKGVGTTVLRLTADKRNPGRIVVKSSMVYNGEYRKPKVTVYDEMYKKSMTSAQKKARLIPSTAYTVKYKYNKKCGTARAIVTMKSGSKLYKGKITGYFTIKPKKSVIKEVTEGKGKLTIKVKSQKSSGAKYYQAYYRIKGTSKWLKKTFMVSKGSTLVIKNLKKGKRYQVKVRAYVAEIKKDAGAFSKIKTSDKIQ